LLKKRVIPVLLLQNGRMVKGKQFTAFRDTGDPRSAARIYNAQYADELVFLDIQASRESRGTLLDIVQLAASECFMPLTVGGGITQIEDVRALLRAGADKVVITTAAVHDPSLIRRAAETFGSQCIVAGVDYRGTGDGAVVWVKCGTEQTAHTPQGLAKNLASLGAGEILLNSIDRDGMMGGYDLVTANVVANSVGVPVIVCGGAGNFAHLAEAFNTTSVGAVACASVFHFGDNNPIRARSHLRNLGIPLRVAK
jgi:imidazole glycerol-phosphate synthase subunit HisF